MSCFCLRASATTHNSAVANSATKLSCSQVCKYRHPGSAPLKLFCATQAQNDKDLLAVCQSASSCAPYRRPKGTHWRDVIWPGAARLSNKRSRRAAALKRSGTSSPPHRKTDRQTDRPKARRPLPRSKSPQTRRHRRLTLGRVSCLVLPALRRDRR